MKPFDEDFTSRVKEAFGSYNADHLADAGWKAFVKKQRTPKGLLVAMPVWAKAASIAILLVATNLVIYRILQPEQDQIIATITEPTEVSASVQDSTSIALPSTPVIADVSSGQEVTRSIEPTKSASIISYSEVMDVAQHAERDTAGLTLFADNTSPQGNDVVTKEVVEILAETPDSLSPSAEDAYTKYPLPQLAESPVVIAKSPRTRIMAGLSGMMARVENLISDAPAVSVGLYTEHRLTDNIYIRPGLAFAKHSYGLQSVTNNNRQYDAMASATDNNFNSLRSEVESFENHMDLVVMEIPINFVFNIRERRNSNIFVSVGSSSLIYLNQQFTGTLRVSSTQPHFDSANSNWYMETNSSRSSYNNEYNAFSRVDLFGLINISSGYIFPFTKHSSMGIEPFIQLPISSLTSSNIRMGFGGVSLKIQLNK